MKLTSPITGREIKARPTPYSQGEWKLVECCETGFVFLPNPPAYDALADQFDWNVTFDEEKQRRKNVEPIVSKISLWGARLKTFLRGRRTPLLRQILRSIADQKLSEPARILDIGCAAGGLMHRVIDSLELKGYRAVPFGIEISPSLCRRADSEFKELGGFVVEADALKGAGQLIDHEFDVVVMSSFLEHEAQPLELLKRLHAVLPEHGRIVIKVPNFSSVWRQFRGGRWCGFRYPDHVNYFTSKTLSILADSAGFQLEPQSLRDRMPTSDSMYAILSKRQAADVSSRIAA